MVSIDFKRNHPLASPTSAVPVCLCVNDREILGLESDKGGSYLLLSLVSFSMYGLLALRVAKQRGKAALVLDDWGGDLLFHMQGEDDVSIHLTGWNRTAHANYNELLKAWETFALEARSFIVEHFPDMYEDAWWDMRTRKPTSTEADSMSAEWWFEQERDET